jgi:hypothetical protein
MSLPAAAAGVVAAAGWSALSAAQALERAQTDLADVSEGAADPQGAVTSLRQAERQIEVAEDALARWPVDVVAAVPVLGRSWRAERAVTRTAQEVVAGAAILAEGVPSLRMGGGSLDLGRVAELEAEVARPARRAAAALERLERTSVHLTPPQVASSVEQALVSLTPAVDALASAHTGLDLVSGLLGESGPRSVLVMLQNNAELRGAGGYAASYATGRSENGRLTLAPLRDVVAVADSPYTARRVPAPEEYLEDYEALSGNTTMWRTWNMSPHVPDSALVGARIAGELLGTQPDVVVLLDVPAMTALAGLGDGSVVLPDGSAVGPDELEEALLVDSYASAGEQGEAQVRRRQRLQAAASGAVTRLLTGEVPATDAARTLSELAARRHLAVWSARAQEQRALVRLGLAADLAGGDGVDLSHVSVNNIGGNKLDLYVHRRLEVDVEVGPVDATVVQRVTFTNNAPDGLVRYVAGAEQPGVVVSRVELSLAPEAHDLSASVDGKPWLGALHDGPARRRLISHLELPQGATSVVEVRYSVPVMDGEYRLRVVPQALLDDADLRLSVRAADGEQLADANGAAITALRETGQLSATRDVQVGLRREPVGFWARLSVWWRSPVQLAVASAQ